MATPELEVRCPFCRRHPLLGVCGRADDGAPFVHIKSYKSQRLYTEVVITSGVVRIRCRDCKKWMTLTVKPIKVHVTPEQLPESIPVA